MSTKQEAATLLASGLSLTAAASKLGVTVGYLSQIQEDSEYQRYYQQLVSRQRVVTHSTVSKIDGHYDSLELKFAELIDRNSEVVLASMVQDPKTILRAMETFNKLKRRSVGESVGAASENEVVRLVLPDYIVSSCTPVVKHNSQNEVIEVDGRTLVSLSDTALKSQLAELTTARSQVKIPNLADPLDTSLLD